MMDWKQRFPIIRQTVLRRTILEIEFPVVVRTKHDLWSRMPFLLDTASQFTTVPLSLADQLGLAYTLDKRVHIRGTAGITDGFMAPIWFAFPSFRSLQFEASCCFSTSLTLKRALLSLTDFLDHFTLRTLRPTRLHPLGSVVVRLHKAHQGIPMA